MIFYGGNTRQYAEERNHEPHPDDLLPPAPHLQPGPGVDAIAAFATIVRRLRIVGPLTRCAHPHCRATLTEDTVTYCPHDRPFHELCTWEEGCDECSALAASEAAQDACDDAEMTRLCAQEQS